MTDLIPRDAAISAVNLAIWKSPIKAQISAIDASNDTAEALRAIPAIDTAAIREAALTEAAAKCAEHAEAARKKIGAAQTREEANAWGLIVTRCDLLEDAILALIGEKK